MKSPFIKLAAAAVVVAACIIGISLWRQTGSGIALAEVLARMEQVQAYRLRMSTTFQAEGAEAIPVAQATTIISRALGQKVTMQLNHPITGQSMLQEIYVLPLKRTVTTLMPDEKQYSKIDLDDASIERWQQENDPRWLVERVVKCEHTCLGRSIIDGVEVEGFRTTDTSGLGESALADAEVTVWADVESKLPVRLEVAKGKSGKGHVRIVADGFEWDVAVDAAEFEPIIPPDYAPGQPMMQLGPRK